MSSTTAEPLEVTLAHRNYVRVKATVPGRIKTDEDAAAGDVRAVEEVHGENFLPLSIVISIQSVASKPVHYPIGKSASTQRWTTTMECNPHRSGDPDKSSKAAFLGHESVDCPPGQSHEVRLSGFYHESPIGPDYWLLQRVLSPRC